MEGIAWKIRSTKNGMKTRLRFDDGARISAKLPAGRVVHSFVLEFLLSVLALLRASLDSMHFDPFSVCLLSIFVFGCVRRRVDLVIARRPEPYCTRLLWP